MNFSKSKDKNLVKPFKNMGVFLLTAVFLTACSDDEEIPAPINEEELITTLNVSLVPEGGGTPVVLSYRDLDGDGPQAPEITEGVLTANTTYSGSIELLNETEEPAENITVEVQEEGLEHQFFFSNTAGLTTNYTDQDSEGNPIGLAFTLETGEAAAGSFTLVLRHEPDKNAAGVADGNIENAGGETDISVTFGITVE